MSCGQRTNDSQIIGSTIENINNSEWSVAEFWVDDEKCFVSVNQYFQNYPSQSNFPYCLWITVGTKEQNDNGHPTSDEAQLFNQLEDSVILQLDGKTPYCFIGRTTMNGYREIMIYVSDKEASSELLNNFIKTNQFGRTIEFEISPDESWNSVSGLIE